MSDDWDIPDDELDELTEDEIEAEMEELQQDIDFAQSTQQKCFENVFLEIAILPLIFAGVYTLFSFSSVSESLIEIGLSSTLATVLSVGLAGIGVLVLIDVIMDGASALVIALKALWNWNGYFLQVALNTVVLFGVGAVFASSFLPNIPFVVGFIGSLYAFRVLFYILFNKVQEFLAVVNFAT